MKSIGYAVILVALVIGGGLVCNFLTRMAEDQCGRQCPQVAGALSTKFEVGPFRLAMCNCGTVKK